MLCQSIITYSQNYPGKNIDLLVDKEIRVLEKREGLRRFGYRGFYESDRLTKVFACDKTLHTEYSALVGKVFRVLAARPNKNAIGTEKHILEIENPETGRIYFDYHPEFEYSFPFEVIGGLTLPEEFYCGKIKTTQDKFNTKTKMYTAYLDGISFMKITENDTSKTYLSTKEIRSKRSVDEKGLTLLLDNGMEIQRPNITVDVKTNTIGNGYEYSTLIELTNDEVKTIIENKIVRSRFHVYEEVVTRGEELSRLLKCMTY